MALCFGRLICTSAGWGKETQFKSLGASAVSWAAVCWLKIRVADSFRMNCASS